MAKQKNPSFIAIGVGQGDAFFLEKAGFAVLIDGGRSLKGFPVQFQRMTKRDNVDILVCTHNDADHALGILGFLSSGLTCKEVWLPGSWTARLEDLLLDPGTFMKELLEDIQALQESRESGATLQEIADKYSEGTIQQEGNTESSSLAHALSDALETRRQTLHFPGIPSQLSALWFVAEWQYAWPKVWFKLEGDPAKVGLFIEAISAASLIREIALAAYHAGALIRWFEYDVRSNTGGVPQVLWPLNAREILPVRRPDRSALTYLALTTSNRQSLVFISPANGEEPAVLFTADSDLSFFQPIPCSNGMIVTAPHHGSEENANAYRRLTNATGGSPDVVWVRSDGRFKSRPGNSYLKVCGSRFCTLCRGSTHPKQDVRLTGASGKWRPVFTRKCCCV